MLGKGAEILEINERLKLGSWEAGKRGRRRECPVTGRPALQKTRRSWNAGHSHNSVFLLQFRKRAIGNGFGKTGRKAPLGVIAADAFALRVPPRESSGGYAYRSQSGPALMTWASVLTREAAGPRARKGLSSRHRGARRDQGVHLPDRSRRTGCRVPDILSGR